jgi:DNA modification methylase
MLIRCSHDAIVSVKDLKPNPLNRNSHPKDQIERLAKVLEYQGWRYPIKVSNRSGLITSGHGRLEAAKLLKWKEVPVSFQDYDSEEQEYADTVSDNSIASWSELDLSGINSDLTDLGPDFDIDLLGIKDFVLEPIEKLEPQCDEDEVPDALPEPKVVKGEVYILGNHRLMCGDSTAITDVERLMDGKKAELCFTSPPYADQREYNGGKELSTEYLATFIRAAYGKARYFAVNLGYSRKDGEVNQYWDDYIKEAKNCGLKLLSWNVWDKGECGSIGNQSAMFGISHEWIFVFGEKTKDLHRTLENKSAGAKANHTGNRQADGKIKKSKERIVLSHQQLKTVYSCTAQKARDEINHPARFPVEFPEGYIEAMTNFGDSVFEPFGGSGSTLIACEKTDRHCFMMELDPHYCGVILDRWQKFTGKKAQREDGVAWDEIKAGVTHG